MENLKKKVVHASECPVDHMIWAIDYNGDNMINSFLCLFIALCAAVEASKFQKILIGQGEKEHHENNIEMKPLIKIVKISTVKIEKDLATKVVNNGGQEEHQNHQEDPTKKVLLETNFPEIIAEEEEANDDVLYPKSSSTRRHISSPQKNSKPPLTKMENGIA